MYISNMGADESTIPKRERKTRYDESQEAKKYNRSREWKKKIPGKRKKHHSASNYKKIRGTKFPRTEREEKSPAPP